MDQLVAQKKVQHNIFAFYLSSGGKAGSMLTIGGTDPAYYTGDFSYVSLSRASAMLPYWLISASDIKVDGASAKACSGLIGCQMVVDTGTSVFAGPLNSVKLLVDKIGDVAEDCSNVGSLPTISISFAGQDFELGPEFYVLRAKDDSDQEVCQ